VGLWKPVEKEWIAFAAAATFLEIDGSFWKSMSSKEGY
jgi:hypothetical protein